MELTDIIKSLREYYPLRDIRVAYQLIKAKKYEPIDGLFAVLYLTEHKFSKLPEKPTRADIVLYAGEYVHRKENQAEVLF